MTPPNRHQSYRDGHILNQTDAELAQKGFASDMPLSNTRLLAMLQSVDEDLRLVDIDIADIETLQIAQADKQLQLESLLFKKNRLLQRQIELQQEINRNNPFQKLFGWGRPTQRRSPLAWLGLAQNQSQEKPITLNDCYAELNSLRHLMEKYLHDPTTIDPKRMAALVSQFDRQVKIAEKLAKRF